MVFMLLRPDCHPLDLVLVCRLLKGRHSRWTFCWQSLVRIICNSLKFVRRIIVSARYQVCSAHLISGWDGGYNFAESVRYIFGCGNEEPVPHSWDAYQEWGLWHKSCCSYRNGADLTLGDGVISRYDFTFIDKLLSPIQRPGTPGISRSEIVYLWPFVSFKTTILCKHSVEPDSHVDVVPVLLQELFINTTMWPYKTRQFPAPVDPTLILIQIVCASEISKPVFITTMQAQQMRNTTQAINYTQSLAAVQTLLRAGLGAIAYLRFVQLIDFLK